MKKRIHILTADEHRRLMVDPDEQWGMECGVPKYRKKYFVVIDPYGVLRDERAPEELADLRTDILHVKRPTKYVWPVLDTTGMRTYGKPAAYFKDHEAANEWVERENALCPPPPKPLMPGPPYPLGTYFVVITADQRWEIRRVSKPVRASKTPYQQRHYTWSEKTISVHQTKQDAKRELIRLITKK